MLKGSRAEAVGGAIKKRFKIVNEICAATLWNWVGQYVDALVPFLLSLQIDCSGDIYLDEIWEARKFTAPDGREYTQEFWLWTSYDPGKKTRPAAELARSRDASVAAEVIMRILTRVRMPDRGITFWCDDNSAYPSAYQGLVKQGKVDAKKVKMICVPKERHYSIINPVEGVNSRWRQFLQRLKADQTLERANATIQRQIVVEDFFHPREEYGGKSAAQNANAEIDFGPNETEALIKLKHMLKAEQFKKYVVPTSKKVTIFTETAKIENVTTTE